MNQEPEPTDEPMGLARRNQDRAPYMCIGQELRLPASRLQFRDDDVSSSTVVGKISVIGQA